MNFFSFEQPNLFVTSNVIAILPFSHNKVDALAVTPVRFELVLAASCGRA